MEEPEKIRNTKEETIEFIKRYGLKATRVSMNKAPLDAEWNRPEVYEPAQEEYFRGFLNNMWNLGLICGVKTPKGYFFVCDIDSKEVYERIFKKYEGLTTVVKSGGPNKHSRHFYFFSKYPIETFRVHKQIKDKKGNIINIGLDVQGENTQVLAPMSLHPETLRPYVFLNKKEPMLWEGDVRADLQMELENAFGIVAEGEEVNITELLTGPIVEGNRDNAAIRVATWYRQQGKSEEEALALLKEWNLKVCRPPLDEAAIEMKVKSAYRPEKPYAWKFVEKEVYTPEEIAEAEKLIENPEYIFHYIYKANSDIVGENKNKVLIPVLEFGKLSFEITGKYGSGKSELVKRCLECFPAEWYLMTTGVTDKALRWLGDYQRTLVIAERKGIKGGEEESTAEYDIKVGISEGEIKIIYPEKGPDGKIRAAVKRTKVDNFIFTSTDVTPPEELENRIFNLVSDESEEQNIRFLKWASEEAAKFKAERASEEAKKAKKILRYLFAKVDKEAPNDYVIPWLSLVAEKLFVPYANDSAIRRQFYKLRDLIGAAARLFYKKLPVIEGHLVVSPEVFWYVWQIADEAIFTELARMNQRQLKAWQDLQRLFSEYETLSTNQIMEAIGYSRKKTIEFLKFFQERGLVELIKAGENHQYTVKLLREKEGKAEGKAEVSFNLSDLEKETEKWLKNRFSEFPPGGAYLPLIEYETGKMVEKKEIRKFGISGRLIKPVLKGKNEIPTSSDIKLIAFEKALEAKKDAAQG
jgi:hypothetical protein